MEYREYPLFFFLFFLFSLLLPLNVDYLTNSFHETRLGMTLKVILSGTENGVTHKDILLKELAARSLEGERKHQSIDQFYKTYPDLTVEDGYAGMKYRLQMAEKEGFNLCGFKMGGTTLSKQKEIETKLTSGEYIKSAEPKVGFLMDYMNIEDGAKLIISELIHPKIETELAFVMEKELYGPNVLAPDVMMATAYVTPAFEIIDSRFHDFKMGGKADALIDNVSSARFKLGRVRKSPFDVDMIGMGVSTRINGEFTGYSAAGAVMGHPARAIISLARTLYKELGMGIPAGSIILTGAICASHPVKKGDHVEADFAGLGTILLDVG